MKRCIGLAVASLAWLGASASAQAETPDLESIELLKSMVIQSGTPAKSEGQRSYTGLSGRYEIVLQISLQSGQSTGSPLTCYGSIQLDDAEVAWSEIGRTIATRNGNSAWCRVAIPFSWSYVPTTGRVKVVYAVGGGLPTPRTREALSARFFPLPANGAVTTRIFNVRL